MKSIIAGNSHVACMYMAARESSPDLGGRAIEEVSRRTWRIGGAELLFTGLNTELQPKLFAGVSEGQLRLRDREVRDKFSRLAGNPSVQPSRPWGICNVANVARRFYRDPMWLSYAPSKTTERSGAVPLTDTVLRSMIEDDQRPARVLYERLVELGVPVFAIAGPPPRANHASIVNGVAGEVIVHLDALTREVWRDWLESLGIEMVDAPTGARTASGFLRAEYEHVRPNGEVDHHHANASYGKLMLGRIADFVADRFAD